MDDIVSQLIRQAPQDRPMNVEQVKHLLIARKNEFITRQRISELTQEVVPVGELDDILIVDPIRLVDFDWNRELLTLVLNHPVSDGWIWALGHMGDHSSLLGYGPEYFSFRGDRATIECPERIVQQVINHFKAWLPNANTVYKQKIERDLRESERALQSKLEQELSEARERVLRDINS